MKTITCIITQQCNLNCSYCYVTKKDLYMSFETWKTLYEQFKQSNKEIYRFDYFGGEPLLNWDLIEKTVPILKKDSLCKEIYIVTNGLLITQKKVNFLKQHNVNIVYSFDGLWNNNRNNKDTSSNTDYHLQNSYLIKQLTNECNCCVTPNSLDLWNNFKWILDNTGLKANYIIVEDINWNDNNIKIFEEEFKKLCNEFKEIFLNTNSNPIPGIIKEYLLCLREGVYEEGYNYSYKKCEQDYCWYIDGNIYNCINKVLNDNYSVSNTQLNCSDCEWKRVCKKQCSVLMSNNQHNVNNLCDIFDIIFKNIIKLNNELKYNKRWCEYINNLFNGVIK